MLSLLKQQPQISACQVRHVLTERLGETVKGQRKVDMYGDIVQTTNIPGDHWQLQHDQIKHVFGRLCIGAGMPCELEVFNIFSGLIP